VAYTLSGLSDRWGFFMAGLNGAGGFPSGIFKLYTCCCITLNPGSAMRGE